MSTNVKPFKHHSKTRALSEYLTTMAHRLGPNAKLPTVQALRQELNVSLATLDSALSQLEVQKVICRKHGVGIFVSPELHQKAIGLVCDPSCFRAGNSPFWQQLIEEVQMRAASKEEIFRFYLGIPSSRTDSAVHEDLRDDVLAGRVHGLLFIGENRPAVRWLTAQGIPIVVFAGWGPHHVIIDYDIMVSGAIDALIAKGCRSIGLLSQSNLPSVVEPFQAHLIENGLAFHPEWVWDGIRNLETAPDTNQEQGYQATLKIFGEGRQGERPDGMVIVDDMMTRGALVALQSLGIQPGHGVEIATHINQGSAVLQGYESALSFFVVNPSEIVTNLFLSLQERMLDPTLTESKIVVLPYPLLAPEDSA